MAGHDRQPAPAARARYHRDPLHPPDRSGHRRCSGRRRRRGARLPVLSVSLPVRVPLPLRVSVPPLSLLWTVQRPASRLGCRPLGVAPESIGPVCPGLGPTVSPMKTLDRRAAVVLAAVLVAGPVGAAGPYPPYPPNPTPPPPQSAYQSSYSPQNSYPPPRVIDPNPPPLSPMMRVIYAPFYITGLVLR